MTEDLRQGGVTWHSTEDDGPPDVGVSLYLGEGKRLWCGEISQSLYDECRGFDHFNGDHGWFIVFFSPSPKLVAKVGDQDDARAMMEWIAWLAREVDAPTLAKTLAVLEQ